MGVSQVNEEVEACLDEPQHKPEEITEEEAYEFLRFIKQSEYKVVDQLNRTPARISILSLLMSSEAHRNVLMKVLNQAHASCDISTDKLGGIINNIIANASFMREETPTIMYLPSDASLMMAKVMMKKGFQLGEGLGRFSQGRKCIVVPQHNKYRYGLGYKSTQEDMRIMTEEKKKSITPHLGQYEYKAKGMYIPYISRSFVSAGIESRMIAVIGDNALEDSKDYVVRCPPGTILNNWIEEDASPQVFLEAM
ncbi:hypothetical protein Lal_00001119 [Lupinus albus]|nr:hypothetical protein Lal_00001119 [Lupinus albus]